MTNNKIVVIQHLKSGDMYRADGPGGRYGCTMRLKYAALKKLRADHPKGEWEFLVNGFATLNK